MPAGVEKLHHLDPYEDDFNEWVDEQEADSTVAGAIEDAVCRSNLLAYLVHARHLRGLSQSTVAKAMETSQSAVSDLEGGGTDPRLSTLQRYGRALDCAIRVHVEPAWMGHYIVVNTSPQALGTAWTQPAISLLQPEAWISAVPVQLTLSAGETDEITAAS